MKSKSKTQKPGAFCGAAADLSPRMKRLTFLLLLALAACLCYSQFGIIEPTSAMTGELNIVLFLIPVALAVVMLGVVPGIGLGFLTGIFIMFRAQWTPTNIYDSQLADPFLSVASIMVGAALMAAIVTPCARRWPADLSKTAKPLKRIKPMRIASIIIGCFVLASVVSYGSRGLIYLFITPGGAEYGYAAMIQGYLASLASPMVLFEALLNAAILSFSCVASVIFDAHRRSGAWKSGLSAAFNRWLLLSMVMVFMLASTVSFCVETSRAMDEAEEQLIAELQYLQQQVDEREKLGVSVMSVADGYRTSFGGIVVVLRDKTVISSNNPDLIGLPASRILGSEYIDNYDFLLGLAADNMLTGYDNDLQSFEGLRALVNGDYTFIETAPLATLFKARTATLVYNSFFLLLMLAVVFLVAHRLLRFVVVRPIQHTNDTLSKITAGELSRRVSERDVREFDELSTGINTTVSALRSSIAEVEHRNEQDIMAAKAIQESALPGEFPPFPQIDRFDIYASLKMAKGVGGDFYDFFLIDDDKLAFLVADVSGKGIPASLFMMSAKTHIQNYMKAGLPVNEAVAAANHQLCIRNEAGMFVTMFACVLNYETGELSYANAGHNPPLLHHNGAWEWIRDVSGMPLGLFDGMPYDILTRQLDEDDTMFLYSDGVTEAMSIDGTLFSEERLIETIDRFTELNARSVSLGIQNELTDFTKGAVQSDDITILVLRYGMPPEKRAFMTLPARADQLTHVYNFIHEELHRRHAPRSAYNPLDIAAEELFVNVCHYAYPDATPDNPGEVRIGFEYEANPPSLTVTISDDGIPYDPLAAPDKELPEDIASATIGGMGILMAKQSVDEMYYERVGDSNVLTFRKSW